MLDPNPQVYERGAKLLRANRIDVDFFPKELRQLAIDQNTEFIARYSASVELVGSATFNYKNNDGKFSLGHGELLFETRWSSGSDSSIHVYRDGTNLAGIGHVLESRQLADVRDASAYDMTSRVRTPNEGDLIVLKNGQGFYAVVRVDDIRARSHGDSYDSLTISYCINTDGSERFTGREPFATRFPNGHASDEPTSDPLEILEGIGGRGGGGDAVGRGSKVIGGRGGRGGEFGRGGDGGGGDALGDGAIVYGGDGGDASRSDGRGGKGGQSSLKKLAPETLRAFGLTGNEGYGQGGSTPNTPEYDRRLRVLSRLSAEFDSEFPSAYLRPMPGVLMPPIEWVNRRLEGLAESFVVEFIDNETDFFLHDRRA